MLYSGQGYYSNVERWYFFMWIVEKSTKKCIRYACRERFTDPATGKKFILTVTMNNKSKQAQRIARQRLLEKFNKKISASQKEQETKNTLSFSAVCTEWLQATEPTVKIETRDNHKMYVRRILKGLPSDTLFCGFTPAMAEHIINDMYYKEKLSYAYTAATLVTLKMVMRYAKKAAYIENISDFESIRLKKRPATPEELQKSTNKFLNHDELKEALHQLREINTRVALAMEFISLTGLRCGEMLALRWQDIDIDKRQLNVNGTLVKIVHNNELIQRGTPKNVYSYRTIALNTRSITILEWFKADNKKMELWKKGRCISRTYHDHGYIFTTRSGAPYNIQFINKLLRKLDIPGKKISTHIFRHTHISMLAEMNVPLKAIMQRVGHNDPNTTLQIYTHVTDNMKKELTCKLEKISI